MKNLFLMLAASMLTFSSMAVSTTETSSPSNTITINDWSKADAWAGKDGKTWYKLDKATLKIWLSADGKKWEEVKDGMWQDKDGKWLKIGDKKLWWSADGGKNWSEVPEWKWQGGDNKWYKFDAEWNLWKN